MTPTKINPSQVVRVLLPDGWHMAKDFRITTVELHSPTLRSSSSPRHTPSVERLRTGACKSGGRPEWLWPGVSGERQTRPTGG
jgi:hypothetical protein